MEFRFADNDSFDSICTEEIWFMKKKMTNSVSFVIICKYINMMGLEAAPPPSQSFEGNSGRSSGFFFGGGCFGEIIFID